MQLFRAESAERDLDGIADWYAQRDPAATLRLLDRIADTEQHLLDHPRAGRKGRVASTREMPVPHTPFILIYLVTGELLYIVRVLHHAQQWPPAIL